MGEAVRHALDQCRIFVDAKHFVTHPDQRMGDGAAEPAEADDEDGAARWRFSV